MKQMLKELHDLMRSVNRPLKLMEVCGTHTVEIFRHGIRDVMFSDDGGRTWREAKLEEPIMEKCLTRFKAAWNWDGQPAVLMSRAVDSTGYVQPSVQDITKKRAIVGFVQHHNAIQPWSINAQGEVRNVIGQA